MASGGSFSRSVFPAWPSPPPAQGLYDPKHEHDACGVGFVAHIKGQQVARDHQARPPDPGEPRPIAVRSGADPLVATARASWCRSRTLSCKEVRPARHQAARARRLRRRPSLHAARTARSAALRGSDRARRRGGRPEAPRLARRADRQFLPSAIGDRDRAAHRQVFIGRGPDIEDDDEFERRLYILRKVISNAIHGESAAATSASTRVSLSCRTLVYKGMFLAYQLGAYYPDLHRSALRIGAGARPSALLDQHLPVLEARPSLPHGRPQRRDQHAARQSQLDGGAPGQHVVAAVRRRHRKLWPISYEGQSDTACFDNALEFLVRAATRSRMR